MGLTIMVVFAAMAFFAIFSPWVHIPVSFWLAMTVTAGALGGVSFWVQRKKSPDIFKFKPVYIQIGVMAAGLLYVVFWIGHLISVYLLPFASAQVDSIYGIREGQNPWLIAGLLLFIIGPAEEIFWRGFVQQRLSEKYGLLVGFIAATAIYTLVHIGSFNFMLIAAAALCGGFWGLLYMLTSKLWPCIISHAVWDVVIFILLPIR